MKTRIFQALLLFLLAGCSGEFVTSREADLAKYPDIKVFIHEIDRFQGEVSDLEASTFRFSYASRQTVPEKILEAIDNAAVAEGWQITSRTDRTRVYKKNLRRYPAQTHADIVFVEYDVENGIVRVEWQAG